MKKEERDDFGAPLPQTTIHAGDDGIRIECFKKTGERLNVQSSPNEVYAKVPFLFLRLKHNLST